MAKFLYCTLRHHRLGNLFKTRNICAHYVVPFVPVLKLLLLESGDLVVLEGVTIAAGDGYDRFVIPVAEMLGIEIEKDKQ